MGYKYPYIPDKRMYAAVMGACSYIRETGWFNRAVRYYADQYDVDEEELARHIRARQAAGRKGKPSANKGRKFKWFIVVSTCFTEAHGENFASNPQILKGLTSDSVERRFLESDEKETIQNDYGGSFSPRISHMTLGEFDTKEDAENSLKKWKRLATDTGLSVN